MCKLPYLWLALSTKFNTGQLYVGLGSNESSDKLSFVESEFTIFQLKHNLAIGPYKKGTFDFLKI